MLVADAVDFTTFEHQKQVNMRTIASAVSFLAAAICIAQITLVKDWGSDFTVDINTAYPRNLCVHEGVLYFVSETPEHGQELWRSDGTEVGTVMLKDIRPGPEGSIPTGPQFTSANGLLFFRADDGVSGTELWRTDGTEDGTFLVKDIASGTQTSNLAGLVEMNGRLVFRAFNGITWQVWVSDGTSDGTYPRSSAGLYMGGTPVNVGGALVFAATENYPDGTDTEPYYMTDDAIGLIKDINPGTGTSTSAGFMPLGDGRAMFAANDGVHGSEPWVTDGTLDGTSLLEDIAPGFGGSSPSFLGVLNGSVLFAANDGVEGIGLYAAGLAGPSTVVRVHDVDVLVANGQRGVVLGDALYFVAQGELWRTDGTSAGTFQVADSWPGPGGVLGPNDPAPVVAGAVLYYRAWGPIGGKELWRSDGTAEGTYLVQDRAPGINHFDPSYLTVMGDFLYMRGESMPAKQELHRIQVLPGTSIVEGVPIAGSLEVWPNPCRDGFWVEVPEVSVLELFTSDARSILRSRLMPGLQHIDLHRLAGGSYVVRIASATRVRTGHVVLDP